MADGKSATHAGARCGRHRKCELSRYCSCGPLTWCHPAQHLAQLSHLRCQGNASSSIVSLRSLWLHKMLHVRSVVQITAPEGGDAIPAIATPFAHLPAPVAAAVLVTARLSAVASAPPQYGQPVWCSPAGPAQAAVAGPAASPTAHPASLGTHSSLPSPFGKR